MSTASTWNASSSSPCELVILPPSKSLLGFQLLHAPQFRLATSAHTEAGVDNLILNTDTEKWATMMAPHPEMQEVVAPESPIPLLLRFTVYPLPRSQRRKSLFFIPSLAGMGSLIMADWKNCVRVPYPP